MIKRKYGIAVISVCLMALMPAPAMAGWFDASAQPSSTLSDQTVIQIQTALDDQRYLDAGKMLDQALVAAGDDARLTLLAGELNLARAHYDDALANFKKIDAVPALRARALEGEGFALSLAGRSNEAIMALQAAVAQDPNAWRSWNALGTEFDRHHDWQNAEVAYDHAMTISNGSALVLNNRGFSRLSQNRVDDAVADFVTALQRKPDLVCARNNLRLAIAMRGDYARAIAGAGSKDRAAILNNAGFAALLRGDYSNAKDLLGRAMTARGEYYAVAAANLELAHSLSSDHGAGPTDTHVSY
jgi:Flp pilus assembly protein TadD